MAPPRLWLLLLLNAAASGLGGRLAGIRGQSPPALLRGCAGARATSRYAGHSLIHSRGGYAGHPSLPEAGWQHSFQARAAPAAARHDPVSCVLLPSTQVITDIDDTIKSSGGVALAGVPLGGVDTSYARGSFYPGVFQFALELSCSKQLSPASVPKVAVLTARAEEFKFALEIKPSTPLCVRFSSCGDARGFEEWGVGRVLYGSVAEWICQDRKGWRKFDNFRKLLAESPPDRRFVFIGDTGSSERDVEAADRIVEAFPGALRAVFLHAVSSTERPAPQPDDEVRGGVPFLYFRTYATAASKAPLYSPRPIAIPTGYLQAAQHGLISKRALWRVLAAVETDMAADDANVRAHSLNERLLTTEIAAARSAHARLAWTDVPDVLADLLMRSQTLAQRS